MSKNNILEIIEDIKQGKMVIIVDDCYNTLSLLRDPKNTVLPTITYIP